ncbi:hypothetical protein P9294_gp207 [Bacillus phage FADO]|uniref:Uncharacterized protein n=1 Tax=Bacillus phage FADO TaxID=2917160 RepID=A0AAE9K6P0_9CAUD|nr:hypothetical protein P9294_gp207 [Bacillus phage FADO]UNY48922.1 hypothetical protein fado_207 [Bacillus phage FADO]
MLNFEKVSKNDYVKYDKPQAGHIFVTVRENGHQTPYLIVGKTGDFTLLNLNSLYFGNYKGETAQEVIQDYLDKDYIPTNPLASYFFVRKYKSNIRALETFGYQHLDK